MIKEILVINAGSSSIKVAVFDPALRLRLSATLSEIGGDARLQTGGESRAVKAADHEAALTLVLDDLAARGYLDVRPIVAAEESLMFSLPNEIRRDLKARGLSDKVRHDAAALEDAGSLH